MSFLILLISLLIVACSGSKTEKPSEHEGHDMQQMSKGKIYTCPMHPQIIKSKPGQCPICGMDLVEKTSISDTTIDVTIDGFIKPDESVLSSIKTIRPIEKEMQISIKTNGFISYDASEVSSIASRYQGRIEKLYVKYNFQKVEKGQKLFDIYSPELQTAQQDLIFLIKNDNENKMLIDGAKQKLALMGLTNAQIEQLVSTGNIIYTTSVYSPVSGYVVEENNASKMEENTNSMNEQGSSQTNHIAKELSIKEGQYLSKGQSIFKVVNNDKVWALIKLFGSDMSNIKKGDKVTLTTDIADSINAKIDFIQPTFEGAEKYLTARVHLDNSSGKLKIGDLVKAEINKGSKKALWINKEAIIDLGNEKIVLLKTENNLFKVKKISTGITVDNWSEIINGIITKDTVAQNAQFLIDSESFIK